MTLVYANPQTGEYATDEDEEMSPMFPNSIEVFDLAEHQDSLSPVELDPEKLAHKYKEVRLVGLDPVVLVFGSHQLIRVLLVLFF